MVMRGFECVPGVGRTQIVQHEPSAITARMTLDGVLLPDHVQALRDYFSRRLGPDVSVRIEVVDEIPLSSRGKYRRVISTLPLPWGRKLEANLHEDDPVK
jgi:phenylacetate-CoA ligase